MSVTLDDPAQPARLLIVEDDASLRELISGELEDRGYIVEPASTRAAAMESLQSGAPDLILSDLRLPDGSGMDLLPAAQQHHAQPAMLLITAFGSVPQAVEALKAGADDFLTKPVDLEHLAVRIERALDHRRTNVTLAGLREVLRESGRDDLFHGMVGRSDIMRQLFAGIRRIARVDEPVLITGESGTGKELVAKAVHAESARADASFLAVNCAAIPESLLESEFFGHTANAFTGAGAARRGLFAEADGGTLFLDEIGDMPASLQAKLLRVLQEGRFRPLGDTSEIEVDVRIIAATNRDIELEVQAGNWRDDLYYRLETLALEVPPLRERAVDDRIALAAHFLAVLAAERDLPALRLSEEALSILQTYPFPGNVRELANALTRAATFCEGATIAPRHLPARMRAQHSPERPVHDDPLRLHEDPPPTLAQVQTRYIRWILDSTGQNKKRSAQILDVGRRTLYRKLSNGGE